MSDRDKGLEEITRYLRQALKRYQEQTRVRGDFMETVFGVHHALHRAFNLELKESDPEFLKQEQKPSFFDKAEKVIPELTGPFRVQELADNRNYYAHPEHTFYKEVDDDHIRNTAIGFVDLALEVWPRLFEGLPPRLDGHPSLSKPEDVLNAAQVSGLRETLTLAVQRIDAQDRALEQRGIQIQQLQTHLAEKSAEIDQKSAIRRIPWRTLAVGILLLLPIPGLIGFGEYLWRERPIAWYWLLIPAALLLISAFYSLRNLWRFFRSAGAVRIIAALCVGLVIATLVLTPFASRELGWDEKAGAALTRVLGSTGGVTTGYVFTLFTKGDALASRLFPPPAPTLAPGETPASPTHAAVTATPRSHPTATTTQIPTFDATGVITVGTRVIVRTDGTRLLSRASPALGSDVQARFENGTELIVVDGPVERDGFVWWEVESEDGHGWSVADCLVLIASE